MVGRERERERQREREREREREILIERQKVKRHNPQTSEDANNHQKPSQNGVQFGLR